MYLFNGLRLRELEKQHELTDKTLAEKLKLNPLMIWHYRKGNKQPNLHTTKYIAEYFGVPTDELIYDTELLNRGKSGTEQK